MDDKKEALKKLDEIERRLLQLHISLINRKYKYIESDFKNIGEALYYLRKIIEDME